MIKICISKDYSETLGARYRSEGEYSGEDFRDGFLENMFLSALENRQQIEINLDGGYGNPVSFLEEAFGGLARKYGTEKVLSVLCFVSNDEPGQVDEVLSYIKNPLDNQVYKNAQRRRLNGN